MPQQHRSPVLFALLLAATPALSLAADPPAAPPTPQPANEQVVVPQVERREVRLPRFPSFVNFRHGNRRREALAHPVNAAAWQRDRSS